MEVEIGVGTHEAKHWHRRAYGGIVSLAYQFYLSAIVNPTPRASSVACNLRTLVMPLLTKLIAHGSTIALYMNL
jgi:hypothetical protein